jgi:hypothetical protein
MILFGKTIKNKKVGKTNKQQTNKQTKNKQTKI